MKKERISITKVKMVPFLLGILMLFTFCSDDDVTLDNTGEYGETPAEYINFLESNGVDYFLDQFGNPYKEGELLLNFQNGFDQVKLDQVKSELAALNDISIDSIDVNFCPCGTDNLALLEFDQKLDEVTLEPSSGSMGDQDGDDDGLSDETSDGVSTSNNYYNVPFPQTLNGMGQFPGNFAPPDITIVQNYFYTGDQKLKIAVLDSGLDFDHPGLADYENFSIWKAPPNDCYNIGYDFVNDKDLAIDDHGHGTQVTGVILEALKPYDVPVAFMPLKISDENGSVELFDMFCAMSYAVMNGADIVNISAGWYGAPNGVIGGLILQNPDVLFVCSAGNEGIDIDQIENSHFPSGYPFSNVISVGSMNEELSDLADFSNFGKITVAIAAPGENVSAMTPCNGPMCIEPVINVTGTSYAAPYVTAIAAAALHCNGPLMNVRGDVLNLGTNTVVLSTDVVSSSYLNFNDVNAFEDCEL